MFRRLRDAGARLMSRSAGRSVRRGRRAAPPIAAVECLEDRVLLTTTYLMADWDGNGVDSLGTVVNGLWQLDTNDNGTFGTGDQPAFFFGLANDVAIAGDWNGDGRDDIGIVRTLSDGRLRWIQDLNNDQRFTAGIDRGYVFGNAAFDTPVVGNWDGDRAGSDEIGVRRARGGIDIWFLDRNGDGQYTNPVADRLIRFGSLGAGSQAVVGDWQDDGIDDVGVYRNGFWELDFDGSGDYSISDWSLLNPVPGIGAFFFNASGSITGGNNAAIALGGNFSEALPSPTVVADPLGEARGHELILVDPATQIFYFSTVAEPGYIAYTEARYTAANQVAFTARWNLQTFFAGAVADRYDFREARLMARPAAFASGYQIAATVTVNRPFLGSGIDAILDDGLRGITSAGIAGSAFTDVWVRFIAFDNNVGRLVVLDQPRTRVDNPFT